MYPYHKTLTKLALAILIALGSLAVIHQHAIAETSCESHGNLANVQGLNPHGKANLSVHQTPFSRVEIEELVNGDLVCVIGQKAQWYHVQYVRDGIQHTGWVHSTWIYQWGEYD